MANNGRVTLKDVYEVANRLEEKLDKMDERVSTLEIWRANLMGKIAIVGAVVILGFNLVIEYVKTEIFKK